MVEVVVRHKHQLDVLDGVPEARKCVVEGRRRARIRGSGVDERQRLALEEPDVHGPEPRHRQLELRDRHGC